MRVHWEKKDKWGKKSSALVRQCTAAHGPVRDYNSVSAECKRLQENSTESMSGNCKKMKIHGDKPSTALLLKHTRGWATTCPTLLAFPAFCPASTLNVYLMPQLLSWISSEE